MKGDVAKQAQHVGDALGAPIVILVCVEMTADGNMILETAVACVGVALPPALAADALQMVADRFRNIEQPAVTCSKAGGD